MKSLTLHPAAALLVAAIGLGRPPSAHAAAFAPGNLAVVRVGDGSAPLSSTSTNVFIDEYTTAGSFVQTISIPSSGSGALVNTGNSTSEGFLSRSPNGRWICFAGYNTNAGVASVNTTAAAAAPRAIGLVDGAGSFTLAATSPFFNTGSNIRSATTDGTNSFWGCGTAGNVATQPGGVNYFGLNVSTSAVYSANLRVLQLVNGELYFTSGSSTPGIGLHRLAGTPVSAATPAAPSPLIAVAPGVSPYGFAINPAGTIAYIADDGAGVGIKRFTNSAGTWGLEYTVNTTPTRGLVVDWDGGPVLFATTSTNSVIGITDEGAGSSATLLVAGAANTAFRGIAFAPLAPPSISAQPQSLTVNLRDSAGFSVSASGGALTYQWRKDGSILGGQVASTLTLTNVQLSDAGNFDVVVANSLYGVTSSVAVLAVRDVVIAVTNRIYSSYRTDLTPGTSVYVDSDPAANTPIRATQRWLGYREVDYKSQVPATLGFTAATPTTNGAVVTYDYSTQAAKTFQVGFWVDKNVPMVIGPDGNAYITDGHHTTAGYIHPLSPIRQFVPGLNRVILGFIVANYYDPMAGPQPLTDGWWTARAAENNAFLYGVDGDQLTLSGEPNYANLQPVLPSVQAMPTTPSTLTTNGAVAMGNSVYRSVSWGLADGIIQSASDSAGKKIVGYKKSAPGSSVDINFVEFFWADYLRNRVVWDNTLTGSPINSGNGDASVTAAPLSFFAAVANGIALARSEVYRDEYGRRLIDYTNTALFAPNTVNWANGSRSNGLAAATDTYNMYLRNDSTIVGDITPSALSTNILRIDTASALTVTNSLQNFRSVIINGGHTLKTTWKDATVSNTTLTLPAGTGVVTFNGTMQGGALLVSGGTLGGSGVINGSLTVRSGGTLAPGASIGTLTVNGPLTLSGTTVMEINKSGATLTNDQVIGIGTLTYGGTLTLTATGDPLAAGDAFKLFDATNYVSAFTAFILPALGGGLDWDSSQLSVSGTIRVVTSGSPTLAISTQPATQTADVGTSVTLLGGAVGTVPITYQWRFNGSDISGQTGSSLAFASIQESNQGTYVFVASNAAGSVTSSPAILTVNQAPLAQSQSLSLPWNNSINITLAGSDPDGDAFTFTITVQPTHGSLTGTAPNLTYTPVSTYVGPDSFTYRVSDGRLTVTATISLTVQAGFTYRDTDLLLVYRKDGANDYLINLGNVSNFVNQASGTVTPISSFNLAAVQANFGGSLSGVKSILLAVTPLDNLPLRVWLSDADGAGAPRDETLSRWSQQRGKVNAIGTSATTYLNSSNQTLVLPPSDVGSYTAIASEGGLLDVSTLGGASPFPVEQDVPGHLRLIELRVSNANPKPVSTQVGSFNLAADGSLVFTAGLTAPAIASQPGSQSVECGGSATFSVGATGDGPLSYQWYFGAASIGGATASTFTRGVVSFAHAGNYSVVVGNAGGSTTSSVVTLTVTDTTVPALSLPSNITVTRTSAGGATVNYSASASDACDGSVGLTCSPVSGSTFAVGVTTVNCSAGDSHGNTANGSFTVTVQLGFTYQDSDLLMVYRKDGFNDYLINLGNVSNYINQASGTMIPITSFNLAALTANFGGSLSGVKSAMIAVTPLDNLPLRAWLSDADGSGGPRDVAGSRWSQLRGKINAIGVAATTYFTSSNQTLALSPSDVGSYTAIASEGGLLDVSTLGGSSPFPVELDVPGHLRLIEVRVSNANPKPFSTQVGSFDLAADGSLVFTAGVTVPAIASQPGSQSAECGSSATFSVGSTGDGPLSYQWYFGAGPIGGATSSTFTRNPVTLAHAGNYSVVVGNAGGSITSSVVALTVTDTAPISLAIAKAGTNVVVSWPQSCSTYTLERTGVLTMPSSGWSDVGGALAVGGEWQVVVPATETNTFFRLRRP